MRRLTVGMSFFSSPKRGILRVMETPLLQTKLYIPSTRPELVPRLRLVTRLDEGLHRKLTLVSARRLWKNCAGRRMNEEIGD